MNQSCPISFKRVDERAAQINAALTVFSILVFLLTPQKWILLILCIDFFIRGFLDPSYSPYGAVSNAILRISKIKPAMVNAGPKIFAAKIGFLFCCATGICYLIHFYRVSLIAGAMLGFFAALEALFRFCVACKIYPLICKHM
jgi:hypothetical protein